MVYVYVFIICKHLVPFPPTDGRTRRWHTYSILHILGSGLLDPILTLNPSTERYLDDLLNKKNLIKYLLRQRKWYVLHWLGCVTHQALV